MVASSTGSSATSFSPIRRISSKEGLDKALCPGPGQVYLAKEAGLRAYGDYGLNVMGSHAIRTCRELGVEDLTLSFEVNLRQGASLGDDLLPPGQQLLQSLLPQAVEGGDRDHQPLGRRTSPPPPGS